MNARLMLCGLVLALGLGAAALWLEEKSSERDPQPTAAEHGATSSDFVGQPVSAAETRSTSPTDSSPAGPGPEQAVVPLMELNGIAETAAGGVTSEDLRGPLDALLGNRYAAHARAQREASLRSIRTALQQDGARAAGEQQFTPEAVQALQLEADWLKEHLDP